MVQISLRLYITSTWDLLLWTQLLLLILLRQLHQAIDERVNIYFHIPSKPKSYLKTRWVLNFHHHTTISLLFLKKFRVVITRVTLLDIFIDVFILCYRVTDTRNFRYGFDIAPGTFVFFHRDLFPLTRSIRSGSAMTVSNHSWGKGQRHPSLHRSHF